MFFFNINTLVNHPIEIDQKYTYQPKVLNSNVKGSHLKFSSLYQENISNSRGEREENYLPKEFETASRRSHRGSTKIRQPNYFSSLNESHSSKYQKSASNMGAHQYRSPENVQSSSDNERFHSRNLKNYFKPKYENCKTWRNANAFKQEIESNIENCDQLHNDIYQRNNLSTWRKPSKKE